MFKDEAVGKQIVEFVGLRAKLYSYKMLDGSEDKKYKGVTKNVTKRSIQSMTINKIALSSDDDKRVIMADGIHTLAYGHTNLKNCN